MAFIPGTDIPQLRLDLSSAMTYAQTKLLVNYGTSTVARELRDIATKADNLNAIRVHETLPALSAAATAFAECIDRLDDPGRPAPCKDEKQLYQDCSRRTMDEFSDGFERE
jgi:hypothetical protein